MTGELDYAGEALSHDEALRKARDERKALEAVAEQDMALAVQWMMADKRGRKLMRAILAWCKAHATNPPAPLEHMAFVAGQKDIGVRLTALLLQHDTDAYLQMLGETRNAT